MKTSQVRKNKIDKQPTQIFESPIKQPVISKMNTEYKSPNQEKGLQQLHNEKTKTVVKKQFEDPVSQETGRRFIRSYTF